jgi:hypothetical protein
MVSQLPGAWRAGMRRGGILHGCLRRHTRYDETTAWPSDTGRATAAA